MRILSVSDQVEPVLYESDCRKYFSGVDLILSCGDLPPDYLSYLVTMFNVPLLYVSGNHDGQYGHNPPQGCVDMHGKIGIQGYPYNGFGGLPLVQWWEVPVHRETDGTNGFENEI